MTLDDVVVDDYDEVLWRLRALYGLKNFVGQRIVALGGPGGKWDARRPTWPASATSSTSSTSATRTWRPASRRSPADAKLQQQCAAWTDRYLAMPDTKLETKKEFVQRAFALYIVFRQWLREHDAPAITINACMGTILSASDTTACMPLSWLNDEGYLAFCESDFVVMPPGILLHYISGKPVFMHNSTFPHKARGHLRPLHGAAAHGRQTLRAGADHDALRIRLRRRAEGRDADRPAGVRDQSRIRHRPLGRHPGHRARQSRALPSAAASRTWRSRATGSR